MAEHDFSDLSALFINCTLKPSSAEPSNTQALMDNSIAIMEANGVAIDVIRVADHEVPPGRRGGHDRARLRPRRLAGDPAARSSTPTSS